MTSSSLGVRQFRDADVPQVLDMMRALAEFEGYIDDFAVTEDALRQRGFGENREFSVLVAYHESEPERLLGMAVNYIIPYSYALNPELVLKELYVADHARGMGVGKLLMSCLKKYAAELGCFRIRWLVLDDNARAQGFYRSCGGEREAQWETWQWRLA